MTTAAHSTVVRTAAPCGRRSPLPSAAAAALLVLLASATGSAPAQQPPPALSPTSGSAKATAPVSAYAALTIRAAFRELPDGAPLGPPALDWLRHQVLPGRPEWPEDLGSRQAFTVHLNAGRLSFGPALQLPPTAAVAGEFDFGDGAVAFACDAEGRERWRGDAADLPADARRLLDLLHVEDDAGPRTVDLPALLGNLAGVAVDGDGDAQVLAIGAMQCGELTVATWREDGHTKVRGRSDGGLLVPVLLLWAAAARDAGGGPTTPVDAWRLRAFGSRDGDRAEAARQLQRAGAEGVQTLRRMLHADEPSRLGAIDGLLRLRAAAELPRIVAAAHPQMPLSTMMARTAVRELWPLAAADTRAATLRALEHSNVLDPGLVAAGPGEQPADVDGEPAPDDRYRWLAIAATVGAALFGLLLRERARTAG